MLVSSARGCRRLARSICLRRTVNSIVSGTVGKQLHSLALGIFQSHTLAGLTVPKLRESDRTLKNPSEVTDEFLDLRICHGELKVSCFGSAGSELRNREPDHRFRFARSAMSSTHDMHQDKNIAMSWIEVFSSMA